MGLHIYLRPAPHVVVCRGVAVLGRHREGALGRSEGPLHVQKPCLQGKHVRKESPRP